jgi:hypothetical protein
MDSEVVLLTWILTTGIQGIGSMKFFKDWIKKLRVDQVSGLCPTGGFHGWDSLFFMDERMVLKAFQGWIGVFPFFQRSASILSKSRVPLCNLKMHLFSINYATS